MRARSDASIATRNRDVGPLHIGPRHGHARRQRDSGVEPKIVSISGGQPLSVRWAVEAMKRLHDVGIDVTVYTSGWTMKERLATAIAEAVSSVAVSIDGADASIHNAMRGRAGAFERGMKALEILHQVKDERRAAGQNCFTSGSTGH